jgi:carbon-monoxide dehydrogenase medium subunit
VQLTLDGSGAVQKIGIGMTNVGATPLRAKKAEAALTGKKPDPATIEQAAKLAAEESQPSSDLRGPVEYKKGLIREFTKRAITKALERAGK